MRFLARFLVRSAVNALGLWLCVLFIPGIALTGSGTTQKEVVYYLLAGAILGVVNFLVRPILVFLSIPLYLLTLGLFFIVVNAAMLLLTARITEYLDIGISIDSFLTAVLGGMLVGVVNVVANGFLPNEYQRR